MGGESAFSQSPYFWQHGLSLDAAALKFSHPDLVASYDAIARTPFPKVATPPAAEDANWATAIGSAAAALQPVVQSLSEKGEAYRKLCESVRSLTIQGKLRAYGFEIPRRAEDHPKLIPLDVWSGKIDWSQSTVSGHGLSFVAVRLLPVHWEGQLMARLGADILLAQARKSGRPSVERYVSEAYEALKASGRLEGCVSMRQTYEPICEWLAARYPDDARLHELGGETIRKFISARFKADFRRP